MASKATTGSHRESTRFNSEHSNRRSLGASAIPIDCTSGTASESESTDATVATENGAPVDEATPLLPPSSPPSTDAKRTDFERFAPDPGTPAGNLLTAISPHLLSAFQVLVAAVLSGGLFVSLRLLGFRLVKVK